MKILYIIDHPNLEGSEQHLFDILKYFNRKDEIFLICFSDGLLLRELAKLKIKYKIVRKNWIPFNKEFFLFKKSIKKYNPDIIHAHQPKALFMTGLISSFIKIPLIITIHSKSIQNASVYTNKIKKILVLVFHKFIRIISELLADRIICVSQSLYNIICLKKKAKVIYNWVSPKFNTERIPLRNITKNNIKILTVGTVTRAKGYDLLLDFSSILKKDLHSFRLDILGKISDENYFRELKEKSKKLGIQASVNWLGHKNPKDYYKKADFFVLFSKVETFGLVYIEAMNYGLPVFALDIDVTSEIIPNNNSVSNDLNQHELNLINLIKNAKRYRELSIANYKYSKKNFNYYNNMTLLKEEYEKIILLKNKKR